MPSPLWCLRSLTIAGRLGFVDRQFELPFREEIVSESVSVAETRKVVHELLSNPSASASRKSVSLVYEGPLNDRLCITDVGTAKKFFREYWLDNPGLGTLSRT